MKVLLACAREVTAGTARKNHCFTNLKLTKTGAQLCLLCKWFSWLQNSVYLLGRQNLAQLLLHIKDPPHQYSTTASCHCLHQSVQVPQPPAKSYHLSCPADVSWIGGSVGISSGSLSLQPPTDQDLPGICLKLSKLGVHMFGNKGYGMQNRTTTSRNSNQAEPSSHHQEFTGKCRVII